MEKPYFADQTFEKIQQLAFGEYENCTFRSCNLEGADMKNFQFVGCLFEDCNISLVKLSGTSLQEVTFVGCKMQGLHFEACNPFLLAYQFERCTLNLSSFYQTKSKKTIFDTCILHEVDFTEADFSDAKFTDCDLAGALFDRTVLEKADFRTSYNYTIAPALNRLRKAKFSSDGLAGLLSDIGIEIS